MIAEASADCRRDALASAAVAGAGVGASCSDSHRRPLASACERDNLTGITESLPPEGDDEQVATLQILSHPSSSVAICGCVFLLASSRRDPALLEARAEHETHQHAVTRNAGLDAAGFQELIVDFPLHAADGGVEAARF